MTTTFLELRQHIAPEEEGDTGFVQAIDKTVIEDPDDEEEMVDAYDEMTEIAQERFEESGDLCEIVLVQEGTLARFQKDE
jgi:hypothetical protein